MAKQPTAPTKPAGALGFYERLTGAVERHAIWVLAAWLLAAAVLIAVAPSLQDVGVQDTTSFLPASSPSQRADRLIRRLYPQDPTLDSAVIVLSRKTPLTDADRAYIANLTGLLRSPTMAADVKSVQSAAADPSLAPVLRAPDGKAELLIVGFQAAPFTSHTNKFIDRLRGQLGTSAPPGLAQHVTGVGGLAADQAQAIVNSFGRTAIVSVLLVLLILVLVYRSALAPLVPLFTIGVAFVVANGVVALLAQQGFKVASLVGTFMVVIIFGAGTDYCLFIVSRFREELHRGDEVPATVRRTMGVIGAVITASAATVIVGFLSQLTARFGIFRTMGPAMGVAVFITLLAGLTLTPAVLKLAGRFTFWPSTLERVRTEGDRHSPRWERLASTVRARPREILLAGVLLLLLPASGLGWFHQSFDLIRALPANADARTGFDSLASHYPAGMVSPIYLVISTPGAILDDQHLADIDRLTDALRQTPGIGDVRSITQPAGAPLTAQTMQRLTGGSTSPAALGLDPNKVDVTPLYNAMATPGGLRFTASMLRAYPPIAERLGSYFQGVGGTSTRLIVSLRKNPFEPGALGVIKGIDGVANRALAGTSLSGAHISVGGPAAFFVDMQELGNADFRKMVGVLVGGIFIVLALLLRSLVAPFYLLATVLLSYAAAMGLTVVVFQGIFGASGISFWLPPFLFIILVALGADYNIFIMSRIREEADAGHEVHDASLRGLVLTGHVITSAGLILVGTFAALLLAPLPDLRQIGFAIAVGVLIDTFVVRSMLVPAATLLLGRWAFWPSAVGGRRAVVTRRQWGLAGGAIAVLGALLVATVAGARTSQPITTVAAGRPAGTNVESLTFEDTTTTVAPAATTAPAAPQATAPQATARHAPATTAAPAQAQAPGTSPAPGGPAGPARIAAPAQGGWQYHVTGTRKIGSAGSTQPFTEDDTTQVSQVGGTADTPEMRVYTQSGSGTQDDRRRYAPDAVTLDATQLSSSGVSYGGTLNPPQVLARWPLRVGDSWGGDFTMSGTQGHDQSKVIGERDVSVGGKPVHCYDVQTDTTFSGQAQGQQHQVACWAPALGMSIDDTVHYSGSYNGIAFDINQHNILTAAP